MEGERLKQLVAKIAKEELREDENTRTQSLEQFRDWIVKNPDITGCRTDDNFLLRFLRTKKFSVPLAQQLLINYMNFRQSYKEIFYHLDINKPDIQDIITNGLCFVSPFRDDDGRPVFFITFRNFDYKKYSWQTMAQVFHITFHCLMENEDTQVTGITYVLDWEDSSPVYSFFPLGDIYNLSVNSEKAYPIRHRVCNSVNVPPIGTWFLNLLMSFLSEKMQQRSKIHESFDDLKKHLNPRVLPKDLGGTMPRAEMIALWTKELVAQRENILSLNNIQVKGDSFKAVKAVGDHSGISGSFKKLQVD